VSVPLGLQPPRRVEFRRPTTAVRRRRRPILLVLLKPLGKAILMVGAPVALAIWLLSSPRFDLRTVQIETGNRVPAPWADTALLPLLGSNLLLLSLDDASQRLADHPWLAEARLRKQLPGTLVVEIEERQPVAVAWTVQGPVYVDEEGESIADVEAGGEEGFLIIRCDEADPESSRNALAAARALTRARPQWGLSLREVEVLGHEDFRLHTSVLPFPLVVRPETVEQGVEHLARALPGLEERMGVPAAADLRYPHRIVLERKAGSPREAAPSVDT
jgi:cell division septal protein FtsQ